MLKILQHLPLVVSFPWPSTDWDATTTTTSSSSSLLVAMVI